MIAFANDNTAPLVRRMWKTCFGDTDEYMDIFFAKKYRNENTLIYFEEGEAVASLQMLPYTITFYRQSLSFAYLAGLCTLPQHRQKGYMAQLIKEAHKVIEKRNITMAILIPAEEWLYKFYEKYGYTRVFDKDEEPIPLADILYKNTEVKKAYKAFNALFEDKDFCVQKSFDDFIAIKDDYILDGYPVKTNLSGMARIIQPEVLLNFYAKANPNKDLRITLTDRDTAYHIYQGDVITEDVKIADIEVDTLLLTRLLFGYRIQELESIYRAYFEEHNPIMNLMLE